MTLDTLRGNVRSLHASYGFEQKIKELFELLIRSCEEQQEKIHDLEKEVADLKATRV